jgi:hypothetical protein
MVINFLSDRQHGFKKGKSKVIALFDLVTVYHCNTKHNIQRKRLGYC